MMSNLFEIFSKEEKNKICSLVARDASHPMTLYYKQNFKMKGEAYLNIDTYVKVIEEHNKTPWLTSIKKRLIEGDHSSADSAFAEIRCFAEILIAGYNVEDIPRSYANGIKTTDFKIQDNYNIVYVDAKNKTVSGAHIQHEEKIVREGSCSTLKFVEPFGVTDSSKEGDSPSTNAISKICNTAKNDSQFKSENFNILWLDLRSFSDWPQILKAHCFEEFSYDLGEAYSGEIWNAFYGITGAPLHENTSEGLVINKVLHDGRFAPKNNSIFNGAIIQIIDKTAFYVNPERIPLPDNFISKLEAIPYFDLSKSKFT